MFLYLFLTTLLLPPPSLSTESSPAVYQSDEWKPLTTSAYTNNRRPLEPVSDNWKHTTTEIYISIVSFQDGERCGHTLNNLISKAKYPNRLKFGITQQLEVEDRGKDDNCIHKYAAISGRKLSELSESMKTVKYSKRMARGAAYARGHDEDMMANEDFCMLVDAHVDVIENWDVELMNMWGSLHNEYGILSTTPPPKDVLGKNINNRWEVPHLCQFSWDENGLVRNDNPAVAINLGEPILSPSWSQSFSFSKCHAMTKTPSDPNLVRLDGAVTDTLQFARLWTRGYDVYSPHRPVVGHDEQRLKIANDWKTYGMSQVIKVRELKSSVQRVRNILGMQGGSNEISDLLSIGRYGLGTKRTLDQLISFTGIDYRNGELIPNRCTGLSWVSFQADIDPDCESGDLWGYAPEPVAADIPLVLGSSPVKANGDGASSSVLLNGAVEVTKQVELPWPLGFIDSGVELALEELSVDYDEEEALEMLKVILLVVPVVVGLIGISLWAILSTGDDMRPIIVDSNIKKV